MTLSKAVIRCRSASQPGLYIEAARLPLSDSHHALLVWPPHLLFSSALLICSPTGRSAPPKAFFNNHVPAVIEEQALNAAILLSGSQRGN